MGKNRMPRSQKTALLEKRAREGESAVELSLVVPNIKEDMSPPQT